MDFTDTGNTSFRWSAEEIIPQKFGKMPDVATFVNHHSSLIVHVNWPCQVKELFSLGIP